MTSGQLLPPLVPQCMSEFFLLMPGFSLRKLSEGVGFGIVLPSQGLAARQSRGQV
jgi:hypothetical protein